MNGDESASAGWELRRAVYGLVIVVACATMTARIATVESSSGKTPLLSANDRSRWAAIRALVDHGTFALDDVVLRADVPARTSATAAAPWPYRQGPPANRDREWYSIDMVRHRGVDGREHYYSSKPPLLNILLAGPYWLMRQLTGATLANQPFYVVRLLLVLINVLPFALYLAGIASLVERHGRTSWGKMFVVATAGFGTLLTPFASTLNNHSVAALAVLGAVWCVDRVWRGEGPPSARWLVGAGVCSALSVVGELPALALVAAVLVALGWRAPRATIFYALPPVVVIGVLAVGANYWVHGSWRPPYAHRQDGPVVATIPAPTDGRFDPAAPATDRNLNEAIRDVLARRDAAVADHWEWIATASPTRYVLWDAEHQQRWAVLFEPNSVQLRDWDNWYEYEGTYWTDESKAGVDRGEPSRLAYAFHVTLGHHGLISLTPVWLLAIVGVGIWLRAEDAWHRHWALGTAGITLVVLVFYVFARPLADRNYGGVCCGFRWMLWLAPLWLVSILPAADAVSRRRWLRVAAWGLLAVSVGSAAYAAQNPWTHPWLFEYWTQLGWIAY